SRTRSVGGRQRRLRYGATAEMTKLAGVAREERFDLAQATCAAQLRIKHRDQMNLGLYAPIIPIGIVPLHKQIKLCPRNLLQQVMKNDILMRHGADPFSVQMIRNQLEPRRINAV